MDSKTAKITSDRNFIKEILLSKSEEEVNNKLLEKGVSLTKEEFDQYISLLFNCISRFKDGNEISESDLEKISAGSLQGAVRTVGKIISFPVRSISYAVGAIVSSVPKGFVDGVYDAWTDWRDYDTPVEQSDQQNQQNQQNN